MAGKAAPWIIVALALGVPLFFAATSPLLAWRDPVYILAGIAGVVGLSFLLLQPMLIGEGLPGVDAATGRRLHRYVGAGLLLAVILHVGGLWVTSPPDVVDALLFASPTPFAAWGVVAMWAVFATAGLAILRRRLRLRWRSWRLAHSALAMIIVVGSVVHAVLIEGTMEVFSKAALCTLVVIITFKVLTHPDVVARLRRRA